MQTALDPPLLAAKRRSLGFWHNANLEPANSDWPVLTPPVKVNAAGTHRERSR
jgi:hypothetical protein